MYPIDELPAWLAPAREEPSRYLAITALARYGGYQACWKASGKGQNDPGLGRTYHQNGSCGEL